MILTQLEHLADTPTVAELEARLNDLPPVDVPGGGASVIQQERAAR